MDRQQILAVSGLFVRRDNNSGAREAGFVFAPKSAPKSGFRRFSIASAMAALRLCLDRILPARRDRPVSFDLPPINNAQDDAATISAVLTAVANGEITPADAGEISKLIEVFAEVYETAELAERIEQLERMSPHDRAQS